MKTIWKFRLGATDAQRISIPKNARFLAVREQHGVPAMWWLVDPDQPPEARRFAVYGTGHDMPDAPGAYMGTFQLHGGSLVFHVFEVPR